MKKVLYLIILTGLLTFSGCGKNNVKDPALFFLDTIRNNAYDASNNSVSQMQNETELTMFTVPKEYIGDITQASLDTICDDQGYHSITLNHNGTATCKMTRQQQKNLLDVCTEQIGNEFHEIIEYDKYPNFTGLYGNEDFTEFIVSTNSKKVSDEELSIIESFRMYSKVYNIISGADEECISVSFINNDTGETIYHDNLPAV